MALVIEIWFKDDHGLPIMTYDELVYYVVYYLTLYYL